MAVRGYFEILVLQAFKFKNLNKEIPGKTSQIPEKEKVTLGSLSRTLSICSMINTSQNVLHAS